MLPNFHVSSSRRPVSAVGLRVPLPWPSPAPSTHPKELHVQQGGPSCRSWRHPLLPGQLGAFSVAAFCCCIPANLPPSQHHQLCPQPPAKHGGDQTPLTSTLSPPGPGGAQESAEGSHPTQGIAPRCAALSTTSTGQGPAQPSPLVPTAPTPPCFWRRL